MLKEKLGEWFVNLSDEERAKYGGLNVDTLVDQLMSVEELESEDTNERGKKKIKNDRKTDSSKRSSYFNR